ncbi:MAG: phage holin family protein [Candidatus Levyibacteriota bacterium]
MRYLLQQYVLALIALFFTPFIFNGLSVENGATGYLFAALLLALGTAILKPILEIVALPIRLLTLGFFPAIVTIFILYAMTIVDKGFSIHPFLFQGLSFLSISIPPFPVNLFLSYVLISVTIQVIYKLFQYVFDL